MAPVMKIGAPWEVQCNACDAIVWRGWELYPITANYRLFQHWELTHRED